MNQLEYLKKFSTIVADSGDIDSITEYKPQDATTNPSLILKSINLPKYKKIIEDSINYAKKKGGEKKNKIINACDKLSVNIGIEILKIIPGKVSTEIDANLSYNTEKCILKAQKIINLYEESGINKSRILIKIAATWEGIKAAEALKKHGINCNLTLLFSLAQAQACAESKVHLISPFVGRIYDWYKQNNLISTQPYVSKNDPGVQSVHKIFNLYKKNNYKTIIMAASFRNIKQVLALSGCDYLTIPPFLLEELKKNKTPITCNLQAPKKKYIINNKQTIPMSEIEFRQKHKQNLMAVEKLSEGIKQFSEDQKKIEHIIEKTI